MRVFRVTRRSTTHVGFTSHLHLSVFLHRVTTVSGNMDEVRDRGGVLSVRGTYVGLSETRDRGSRSGMTGTPGWEGEGGP